MTLLSYTAISDGLGGPQPKYVVFVLLEDGLLFEQSCESATCRQTACKWEKRPVILCYSLG